MDSFKGRKHLLTNEKSCCTEPKMCTCISSSIDAPVVINLKLVLWMTINLLCGIKQKGEKQLQ